MLAYVYRGDWDDMLATFANLASASIGIALLIPIIIRRRSQHSYGTKRDPHTRADQESGGETSVDVGDVEQSKEKV